MDLAFWKHYSTDCVHSLLTSYGKREPIRVVVKLVLSFKYMKTVYRTFLLPMKLLLVFPDGFGFSEALFH